MRERLARAFLIALGGSMIINGIKWIGVVIYEKGKIDAYKEVSKDLSQILKNHKKSKDKESE